MGSTQKQCIYDNSLSNETWEAHTVCSPKFGFHKVLNVFLQYVLKVKYQVLLKVKKYYDSIHELLSHYIYSWLDTQG